MQAITKNYAFEYWIVLDVIIKHSTKPVPHMEWGRGQFVVPTDFFVCCGSTRDLVKVMFSETFQKHLSMFLN